MRQRRRRRPAHHHDRSGGRDDHLHDGRRGRQRPSAGGGARARADLRAGAGRARACELTDRGGLIDRSGGGYEPSATGRHLALYVEPMGERTVDEYIDGHRATWRWCSATSSSAGPASSPTTCARSRWTTAASRAPNRCPSPRSSSPRQEAAAFDWDTVTVVDLVRSSRAEPPGIALRVSTEPDQRPSLRGDRRGGLIVDGGGGPDGWRWPRPWPRAAAWLRAVVLPARPPDAPGLSARADPRSRRRPVARRHRGPHRRQPLGRARLDRLPRPTRCARGSPARRSSSSGPTTTSRTLLADDDLLAVGAAGGDGTLAAVAVIAADRRVPFVAVPAGTLNHLARDLGLDTVDDPIAAVRAGTVVHMDLGVGRRPLLRQHAHPGRLHADRRRPRATRGPHRQVAGACSSPWSTELPRMAPLHLEVDGQRRCGCGSRGSATARYSPDGFGPRWRERLDDGVARRPASSTAPGASPACGSPPTSSPGGSRTCPVYEERAAPVGARSDRSRGRCASPPTARPSTGRPSSRSPSGPAPCRSPSRPTIGRRADVSDRPTKTASTTSTATPTPVNQGPASS